MGDLKKKDCISVPRAQEELGVARNTIEAWMNMLQITRHRFPLDKKLYITLDDYERLRELKAERE